jgi:hypothetical protein
MCLACELDALWYAAPAQSDAVAGTKNASGTAGLRDQADPASPAAQVTDRPEPDRALPADILFGADEQTRRPHSQASSQAPSQAGFPAPNPFRCEDTSSE